MTHRLILLTALVFGSATYADDIYAKQGNTPMVRDVCVVEESDGKVQYFDKRMKKRGLSKAMVGRVVKKRCDVHEYMDREKAAKDADAVMALADWAGKQNFHKDVIRSLHERALGLDKNHEAANLALGRVQHKGEWMTPAEREKRKQAEADAEKRAQGLVEYKGEWVTPEDKARLEKGLVKYKGQWMTADQVKREQGYVQHEGKWIKKDELEVLKLVGPARKDTGLGDKLRLVQTRNCAVMGDLPEDQLKQLASTMEKLFAEWHRLFPDAKGTELLAGKYRLFAFKKNRPYQKLVKAIYARQKAEENWSQRKAKLEELRMRARLKETSFWDYYPYGFSAHVLMPDPFEGLRAHCVHFGANVLATRHLRATFPTWWLNEGVAYYFEKKVTGTIQTFNADVGVAGYADQGPIDNEQKDPWIDATNWNNLLLNMVRTGRDPKLDQIKGKNLWQAKNRLTHRDLAKALSVVTFMIHDNAKKFATFMADAKNGSGAPVEREVAAMLKHYGSYKKVDEAWKKFALNGFRIAR